MIKVLRAPQLDSWRGIVTAYLLIFMRTAPDGLIDNGGAHCSGGGIGDSSFITVGILKDR